MSKHIHLEEDITRKMSSGLTREQALQVLDDQKDHDLSLVTGIPEKDLASKPAGKAAKVVVTTGGPPPIGTALPGPEVKTAGDAGTAAVETLAGSVAGDAPVTTGEAPKAPVEIKAPEPAPKKK